jgi:hypothetical protein
MFVKAACTFHIINIRLCRVQYTHTSAYGYSQLCLCGIGEKKSVGGEISRVCLQRNNILVPASKILPTTSPTYGVKPSVGAMSDIFGKKNGRMKHVKV